MRIRKVQLLKHPNGKSPNWYVRYWISQPDGTSCREKWVSTRTAIKRDAQIVRRQIEREIEQQRNPYADMTWELFVSEFLATQAPRQRAATHAAYKDCLNAFATIARPQLLRDVSLTMLEDFGNKRLANGIAPETVNKDLRHVRAALRWALRRKYLSEVPPFKGAFVRVDRGQPVVIPEADFLAIVAAATGPDVELTKRSAEWWRVFLYLAFYVGLRRGEILRLTWDCISLEHLELHVSSASKGRRARVVPLAPVLGEILNQWKAQQNGGPKSEVLPWPYDSYRQLYKDWHAIQTAAGITEGQHYVPKNCRSACASGLIAAGVPTSVVKDFLGHASVTTTDNYYINTTPALRSAASARVVRVVDRAQLG